MNREARVGNGWVDEAGGVPALIVGSLLLYAVWLPMISISGMFHHKNDFVSFVLSAKLMKSHVWCRFAVGCLFLQPTKKAVINACEQCVQQNLLWPRSTVVIFVKRDLDANHWTAQTKTPFEFVDLVSESSGAHSADKTCSVSKPMRIAERRKFSCPLQDPVICLSDVLLFTQLCTPPQKDGQQQIVVSSPARFDVKFCFHWISNLSWRTLERTVTVLFSHLMWWTVGRKLPIYCFELNSLFLPGLMFLSQRAEKSPFFLLWTAPDMFMSRWFLCHPSKEHRAPTRILKSALLIVDR